jgi:hypothetical protein
MVDRSHWTRWLTGCLLVGTLGVGPWTAARGQVADLDQLQEKMRLVEVIPGRKGTGQRLVYSDAGGRIHIYQISAKGKKIDWDSPPLGSRIVAFFYEDLEQVGRYELVVFTSAGRILFFDQESYDLLWENYQDPFETIDCATVANVDEDPQLELIFVGDGQLWFFDGQTRTREWVISQELSGSDILLANVDEDEQDELILNSGIVVDTRFLEVEWELGKPFGERISLYDLTEDGYPEVFGEFSDFTIKIFDLYHRREVW